MKEYLLHLMQERVRKHPNTINEMMACKLHEIDEVKQIVVFEFPIHKWQLNPASTMHGGILATACDIAMGFVAYATSRSKHLVTMEMQVRYLKPVLENERLFLKVRPMFVGKSIIQLEVDGYNELEDMKIKATGSFKVLKERRNV